jgi:NAD-dependent SIR2 family protein deacetylase
MKEILCSKCNVQVEMEKCKFSYLNLEFNSEVPRCPVCGQVYLSEELVVNRIRQVEANLEEK